MTAAGCQRTQCYALIDFHMTSDNRCLTDDDSGAVVNEEIVADGRTGVDVNAGCAVGMLCHHPGEHGYIHFIQHMCQPVNRNGEQTGVAEDDFICAVGGRVTVVKCFHICLAQGAYGWDLAEEGKADFLRAAFRFCLLHVFAKDQRDLLIQIVHDILNEHGEIVSGVVHPVAFVPGGPGIHNPDQLIDNIDYGFLIRVDEGVELVNLSAVTVIVQNTVYDSLNLLFNGGHKNSSFKNARCTEKELPLGSS